MKIDHSIDVAAWLAHFRTPVLAGCARKQKPRVRIAMATHPAAAAARARKTYVLSQLARVVVVIGLLYVAAVWGVGAAPLLYAERAATALVYYVAISVGALVVAMRCGVGRTLVLYSLTSWQVIFAFFVVDYGRRALPSGSWFAWTCVGFGAACLIACLFDAVNIVRFRNYAAARGDAPQ